MAEDDDGLIADQIPQYRRYLAGIGKKPLKRHRARIKPAKVGFAGTALVPVNDNEIAFD